MIYLNYINNVTNKLKNNNPINQGRRIKIVLKIVVEDYKFNFFKFA